MKAIHFRSAPELRDWFIRNHRKRIELIIKFYKSSTGKESISWTQSVDQALAFGWIDGVRRNLDEETYVIRFTPRRQGSTWSDVNIKKVRSLSRLGLMHESGLKAFNERDVSRTSMYSYEVRPAALDGMLLGKFKEDAKAWSFFQTLAPSYIRKANHWIMSGKHPKTRMNRLRILMKMCRQEKKL